MLPHRLRRWANNGPTLDRCVVLAGLLPVNTICWLASWKPTLVRCLFFTWKMTLIIDKYIDVESTNLLSVDPSSCVLNSRICHFRKIRLFTSNAMDTFFCRPKISSLWHDPITVYLGYYNYFSLIVIYTICVTFFLKFVFWESWCKECINNSDSYSNLLFSRVVYITYMCIMVL